MTVTDETTEPVAKPPPPPPPPPMEPPQAPARSAGPERPQGSPTVSPAPARAPRPRLGRAVTVGLVILVGFITMLAGCGALLARGGGGSAAPKAPVTTLPSGADELAEVNPYVWFPEPTNTAWALIGTSRETRLKFAEKVNDIIKQEDPETKKQIVNPCEIWISGQLGGLGVEITYQRRWTQSYPVPAFICPRGPDGAYIPPTTSVTSPTPAGTVAPGAPGAAGSGKPAGE